MAYLTDFINFADRFACRLEHVVLFQLVGKQVNITVVGLHNPVMLSFDTKEQAKAFYRKAMDILATERQHEEPEDGSSVS